MKKTAAKTSNRGGARAGAGRKKTGRKIQFSPSVSPEVFQAIDKAPEGRSEFIERLVELESAVPAEHVAKVIDQLLNLLKSAPPLELPSSAPEKAEKIVSAIRGILGKSHLTIQTRTISFGRRNDATRNSSTKKDKTMNARLAALQSSVSSAVGTSVEITVRGLRDFTFSAEGNVVDKLVSFAKSLPGVTSLVFISRREAGILPPPDLSGGFLFSNEGKVCSCPILTENYSGGSRLSKKNFRISEIFSRKPSGRTPKRDVGSQC